MRKFNGEENQAQVLLLRKPIFNDGPFLRAKKLSLQRLRVYLPKAFRVKGITNLLATSEVPLGIPQFYQKMERQGDAN
jgi:hypothetical protein